jgi:hypothetical protein
MDEYRWGFWEGLGKFVAIALTLITLGKIAQVLFNAGC